MKQSTVERFQSSWPTRSPNRQLLSLLAALVGKNGGSVELDLETVLDIDPGEAVTLTVEGDKLVLRYSPVQTLIYEVQDTGGPWRNETPASQASRSGMMTDEQLAEQEEMLHRTAALRKDLQEKAQALRDGVTPLTNATQFRKPGKTAPQ